MNARLKAIRALMRKDLARTWMVAPVFAAASFTGRLTPLFNQDLELGYQPFSQLIMGVLLLCIAAWALTREDPAFGLEAGWRLRPIRPFDLVAAKAVLLLALGWLPWTLGAAAAELVSGGGVDAAFRVSLAQTDVAALSLPALAISSLFSTASANTKRLIFLPYAALYVLLGVFGARQFVGVDWILIVSLSVAAIAFSLVLLWLSYGRRAVWPAWLTFAGGVLAIFLLARIPTPALARAQQILPGHQRMGDEVGLRVVDDALGTPGCFPSRRILATEGSGDLIRRIASTDRLSDDMSRYRLSHPTQATRDALMRDQKDANRKRSLIFLASDEWSAEQRHRAGAMAVAFKVNATAVALPPDTRLIVDDVRAAFVGADGQLVSVPSLTEGRPHGIVADPDTMSVWLLPSEDASRLASARLRLDYDLTLVHRVETHPIRLDLFSRGPMIAGFGACTSKIEDYGMAYLTCNAWGPSPALVSVRATPAVEEFSAPNYAPDWANPHVPMLKVGLGPLSPVTTVGRFFLRLGSAPQGLNTASLTTYSVVSHFHRQVLAPVGALGGRDCPIMTDLDHWPAL